MGDWEYKRMQKQQWGFQANASGGRMMPVEGGTCSSQQLATQESEKLRTYHWKGGLSFLTDCKKAGICITIESGVGTYGCMLLYAVAQATSAVMCDRKRYRGRWKSRVVRGGREEDKQTIRSGARDFPGRSAAPYSSTSSRYYRQHMCLKEFFSR